MAQPKPLSSLRATAEGSATQYFSPNPAITGTVVVYAAMDWLKTDRLATASLTPAQARALAIELLQAAETAERTGTP